MAYTGNNMGRGACTSDNPDLFDFDLSTDNNAGGQSFQSMSEGPHFSETTVSDANLAAMRSTTFQPVTTGYECQNVNGPSIRVFNDDSFTWQQIEDFDRIQRDTSLRYAASSGPVWQPGFGPDQGVGSVHGFPYPMQLDLEPANERHRITPPLMFDGPSGQGRRTSLTGFAMERSFPEHMYQAEVNPNPDFNASRSGTPSSGFEGWYAPMSSFPSITTPATSRTSYFQGDRSSATGQMHTVDMAGLPSDQHRASPHPSSLTASRASPMIETFNGTSFIYNPSGYQSQANMPSRTLSQRSHRLSVSDGPPSPTPTETPDFVEDCLTCNQSGCGANFTGTYRRGNFARHLRIVHRRVEYPCGGRECNKVFKRTDARLKHQRKRHPELGLLGPMLRRQ